MYGKGATIPGKNDGSISSEEPCVVSKTAHEIIFRHKVAREAAREADNSSRIKRMLKARIPDYVDRFYKRGDKVFINLYLF